MTVKKDPSVGAKTHVTQLCGGLGIQVRGGSAFPKMSFRESIKGWEGTWFYCTDGPSGPNQLGIPSYSKEWVRAPESLVVVKEEKAELCILAPPSSDS